MGLQTIAEYVEDTATEAMPHKHGVDNAQGYHHGRPEPVADAFRLPATPASYPPFDAAA